MKKLQADIAGKLLLVLVALVGGLACGCSDDDDVYIPPYITELIVASTNSNSLVYKVEFDNGAEHTFAAPMIKAQVPDTAYRCIATYTKSADSYTFYDIEPVFSPLPVPVDSFSTSRDSLPHHPVKLLSIWRSAKYLNMAVGMLTTSQAPHPFAFCIDSVADGKQHISLLHMQPDNDAESYTAKVYMSMPLVGDKTENIVFHINTYDGWRTFNLNKQ